MVIAAADTAVRRLGLEAQIALPRARAMVSDLAVVDSADVEDATVPECPAAWSLRPSPMTSADPSGGVWIDGTGRAHVSGGKRPRLRLLPEYPARRRPTEPSAIADTPGGPSGFLHGFFQQRDPIMTDDDKRGLRPATHDEIGQSLSYALRYNGPKRMHNADEIMALLRPRVE